MRGTGNRTIEDHKKVRITPAHAGNRLEASKADVEN